MSSYLNYQQGNPSLSLFRGLSHSSDVSLWGDLRAFKGFWNFHVKVSTLGETWSVSRAVSKQSYYPVLLSVILSEWPAPVMVFLQERWCDNSTDSETSIRIISLFLKRWKKNPPQCEVDDCRLWALVGTVTAAWSFFIHSSPLSLSFLCKCWVCVCVCESPRANRKNKAYRKVLLLHQVFVLSSFFLPVCAVSQTLYLLCSLCAPLFPSLGLSVVFICLSLQESFQGLAINTAVSPISW